MTQSILLYFFDRLPNHSLHSPAVLDVHQNLAQLLSNRAAAIISNYNTFFTSSGHGTSEIRSRKLLHGPQNFLHAKLVSWSTPSPPLVPVQMGEVRDPPSPKQNKTIDRSPHMNPPRGISKIRWGRLHSWDRSRRVDTVVLRIAEWSPL